MNIENLKTSGELGTGSARLLPRRTSRIVRGFTLIELMVVLAIMAIVLSITVGAFKSLSDNNQRTACQANLVQVYQGLRLYMADENGQPPAYDPKATAGNRNIGLWNLWTYPDPAGGSYPSINYIDKIAPVKTATTAPYTAPTARYLRSTNVLHCPADTDPSAFPSLRPNPADLYLTANKDEYNPDYLSYQMYSTNDPNQPYSSQDDPAAAGYGSDSTQYTYLPVRMPTLPATPTDADKQNFKRQLTQPITPKPADPQLPYYKRLPQGSTIVTWCRHHRYTRDFDNVLFFDGSVQLIAREQDNFSTDGNCTVTGILTGSNRLPRRTDCGE
jgi:prepilin-type N-terminal cleavage/methylation domain-containing protein